MSPIRTVAGAALPVVVIALVAGGSPHGSRATARSPAVIDTATTAPVDTTIAATTYSTTTSTTTTSTTTTSTTTTPAPPTSHADRETPTATSTVPGTTTVTTTDVGPRGVTSDASAPVAQSSSGEPTIVQLGNDIPSDDRGGCGTAVALSSNGRILAVGAPAPATDEAGIVRVYRWGGSDWVEIGAPIRPRGPDETVGTAVALSADGRRVAVSGSSVRVHQWSDRTSSWQQIGEDLLGANGVSASVALSHDGNRLAVGRPMGEVSVYEWDGGLATWRETGGPTRPNGWERGYSPQVAFSGGGDRLAVGAGLSDPEWPYVPETPLAVVYEPVDGGARWTPTGSPAPVFGFGDVENGNAGVLVALSSDGGRLAVGTPGYGLPEFASLGGGRAFDFDEQTTTWAPTGERQVSDDRLDGFGGSIALAANGGRLVIGGPPTRIFDWDRATRNWRQLGADIPVADGVALSADGTRLAFDVCAEQPAVRVLAIGTPSPAVDGPPAVLPPTGRGAPFLALGVVSLALGVVALVTGGARRRRPIGSSIARPPQSGSPARDRAARLGRWARATSPTSSSSSC